MPTLNRQKPEKLGNVVPTCRLQVINEESMKWVTVAICLWTPNAIQAEYTKLKQRGIQNVWVYSEYDARQPLF